MNRKRKGGRNGKVNGKDDQKFGSKDSRVSASSPRRHPTLIFAGQFSSWRVYEGLPSQPTWLSQVLDTPSSLLQVFWVTLKYTNKRKQRPPETFWVSSSSSLNRNQTPPKDILCAWHWVTEQRRHVQKALLRESMHCLEHTPRLPQSRAQSTIPLCLSAVQHA